MVGVVAVVGDSVVNVVGVLVLSTTHTHANVFKTFVKRNVRRNCNNISARLVKYINKVPYKETIYQEPYPDDSLRSKI